MFRQVQMYMGDRKARPGATLNSLLMDMLGSAHNQSLLRDELFIQLCRQTTENPRKESLVRGWELLTIALAFVPPSPVFQPALLGYLNRHRDPTFSRVFPDVNRWPIHVQVRVRIVDCFISLIQLKGRVKKICCNSEEEIFQQS